MNLQHGDLVKQAVSTTKNYAYPSNFGTQDADGVAVVAGVAALLLHAKPNQTFIELRDRIRGGADKVGGYNYTGFLNHSNELAAGRINCEKAALHWPVGMQEAETRDTELISVRHNAEEWIIFFSDPNIFPRQFRLFDMRGAELMQGTIPSNSTSYKISNNHLSNGIYLLQVQTGEKFLPFKVAK